MRHSQSGGSSSARPPSASPALGPPKLPAGRDPLKVDGWVPTATATAQRARAAEKQDYGQSGQLHESRLCSKDQLAALQEAEDEDEQDSAGFLPACKPMSIKTLIVGLRVLETRPEARPLCLSVDSTGLWFDVDTRALDHPGLLPTRPIWWVTKAPGETTGELATEEHAMGLFHVPWLSISRVWATPEPEEAMFYFTLHRLSPISKLLEETYAVANAYRATANRPGKDGRAIISVALDLREGAGPKRAIRWWGRFLTWLDQSYKHGSVALTRPADMTLIVPDIYNDASVARPSAPPQSMALAIWPLSRAVIGTNAFIPHADDSRALDGLRIRSSRPLRFIRERAKYAVSKDREDVGVEDRSAMMLRIQQLSPSQDDADIKSGGWVTLLAMLEEDVEYAELRERSYPLKYVKDRHTNAAYWRSSERDGAVDLRRVVIDFTAVPKLAPRPHVVCDPGNRFPPGFKPALVNDFVARALIENDSSGSAAF